LQWYPGNFPNQRIKIILLLIQNRHKKSPEYSGDFFI